MGSLRFDGVRYAVYSHDHEPAHVHAFYGDKEVVLDLLPEGGVILASRSEKKINSMSLRVSCDYEVAEDVCYIAAEDRLHIRMKFGQRVAIPVEYLQDLADADRNLVAAFEIVGSGSALHWEELDVDFGTEGLVEGLYGNERWMKRLAEKHRSEANAALPHIA